MESVGIEVDPTNQRLERLPAVRLKGGMGGREIDRTRVSQQMQEDNVHRADPPSLSRTLNIRFK